MWLGLRSACVPQQNDYEFSVRVAMLEIYNEEVRDLLSSEASSSSSSSGNGGPSGENGFRLSTDGGGDVAGDGGTGSSSGKLEIRRGADGMIQVRFVSLLSTSFILSVMVVTRGCSSLNSVVSAS